MNHDEADEVRRRVETKRVRDEVASHLAGEEKRAAVAEEEKPSQEELAETVKLLEEALAESERLRREEERLFQEEERLFQEEERLRKGTYFTYIDQVWHCAESDKDSDIEHFKALVRTEAPIFTGRGESISSYAKTKECAMDNALIAADDETTSLTVRTINCTGSIEFPTDIFGNPPYGAGIAHLIPADGNNATLFFDVVIWGLGFPIDQDWDTLQKAIHGVKPEGGIRVPLTGLKHSVSNKICLNGQFYFFDQNPCVFIIPIMDLHEMKHWQGEGYFALVMCGSIGIPGTADFCDASTACQAIQMTLSGGKCASETDVASETDIEKARQLLEDVILGMAYSLLNCFKEREQFLNNDSKNLLRWFVNATRSKKVMVPVARPADSPDFAEPLKVRYVEFYNHVVMEGHPAPDPLLLAVKAAINWSRRHHQPLRGAGEPPEEQDELDVLAEEQFLEWRNNLHRPNTWENLACGLGQPSGYQEKDECGLGQPSGYQEKDEANL